jgi:integrase
MPGKPGPHKYPTSRRNFGWLRRTSAGRWHASYVDPYNPTKRHPRTFTQRTDAEGWLSGERRLIELRVWTPPAQRDAERAATVLTLADYGDLWITQRKLRPRPRDNYQSMLDRLIKPTLGLVPLSDVTAQSVRTWYAGLGTEHPTRNAHVYGLLHAICETAVGDDLMPSNPCSIRGAMNAPTKRKAVEFSPNDVAKLADAIEPQRFKALILIAAWCSFRWGELIELQRKDIGEGCEEITVTRAVTHRNGCHPSHTKEGRHHTVVVPPHIRADLKHHLDAYVGKEPGALLFPPDRGGCHLNDKVFRESYYAKALATIGKDDAVFHDLRHFAATMTARVGNLPETMARLGHSTVNASLRYQQRVSGRDAEIAAALSALAVDAAKTEAETAKKTA